MPKIYRPIVEDKFHAIMKNESAEYKALAALAVLDPSFNPFTTPLSAK